MSLSENRAVRAAYASGVYTDGNGFEWRRGMDGWFMEWDGQGGQMLCYHHDMVAMIERENPDE